MTDAHSSGEPGVRGVISAATHTRCDINGVVGLCMLASAMLLLQASLASETYDDSSRVYVPLR